MTEVIGKINLVPSICKYRQNRNSKGFGRFQSLKLKSSFLRSDFNVRGLVVGDNKLVNKRRDFQVSVKAQGGLIGNARKWWEKGLQPNMREVESAQDLVDSLLNAGDKLVVLDFFSPGCGGCKALHPKICQLAEIHPDVEFLAINYEEHKSMCYSLGVHVLPFFRFYRGALGRVCSFSCTNATIKKFKDALAKHTPDRVSLEPTKGLEEKELIALSENRDLNFTYTPKPDQPDVVEPQHEAPLKEATRFSSNPRSFDPVPKETSEKVLVNLER